MSDSGSLQKARARLPKYSLKSADSKIAEYEAALAKARGEIYAEQSEFLRKASRRTGRARSAWRGLNRNGA